jgi:hypothetical protein
MSTALGAGRAGRETVTGSHYWTGQVCHAGEDGRDWLQEHCSCGYVTPPTQTQRVAWRLLQRHIAARGAS